jgi:hypothetical protein
LREFTGYAIYTIPDFLFGFIDPPYCDPESIAAEIAKTDLPVRPPGDLELDVWDAEIGDLCLDGTIRIPDTDSLGGYSPRILGSSPPKPGSADPEPSREVPDQMVGVPVLLCDAQTSVTRKSDASERTTPPMPGVFVRYTSIPAMDSVVVIFEM